MSLHQTIVDQVPALKRGQVWCLTCGSTMKVNSAECLRMGWPMCCGHTMTIDSPEWRASRAADKPEGGKDG